MHIRRESVNGVLVTHTIDGVDQLQDPSLIQKAVNAGTALGRVVKSAVTREKVRVPLEETARRMAICKGCEFYINARCRKCGCYMNLKSRLETEHCPIGKW